jgi:alpha-galactosidase
LRRLLLFVFVAIAALAQTRPVQLFSGSTGVALEAGAGLPRFSRLTLDSGEPWENNIAEALIDHVEIDGMARPLHWRFQPAASVIDGTLVRFVYDSKTPQLRLFWEWRVRAAPGPIEHTTRIENLSSAEVWLPLQDSFRFAFQTARQQVLKQFWVEKGASAPSAEGTHAVALKVGSEWIGTSSTYAHPAKGEAREIIPYLLIERADAEETGWYAGIEFSGRTRITLRRSGDSIAGELGLNPSPGPYVTRLRAGETFETPAIFIGTFKGGPDGAGNILRRWIRAALNNSLTVRNASYPMLVANSWGSGMAIREEQARRMIQDAAGLGLEMFHLDAGWFRALGDWVSNPQKFPHGVGSVADYAHQMGLRFGLWTDWTQAGDSTQAGALSVHDPQTRDWLTTDPAAHWKQEEFKGITIDIGYPRARLWAEARVTKIVSDFHLDMLEHDGYLVAQGCDRKDHPHAPLEAAGAKRYVDEGFPWVEGANSTDVSYHATRAYYEIQTALRRQFPALLLEVCNDGGRMVDFGSAAHGDYFSITDAYDPLGNRRAFFDASYVLPPAMLETYVEKWPTPRIENFRYMLRSGMMGWFTLMQDSTNWSAEEHAVARSEFALYKGRLRPLIREADVYHVSERPDGMHWDGTEYFDPAKRRGVLYAFRGATEQEDSHVYALRGLRESGAYRVTFHDHSSEDYEAAGRQLTRAGVRVRERVPNSSEVVFFEEVRR